MQARNDAQAAFAALELGPGASRQAVVRAYRRLAKCTHPDTSSASDAAVRFARLTEAYEQAMTAVAGPTPATPRLATTDEVAPVPGPPREEQWIVAGPVTVRHPRDAASDAIFTAGPVRFVGRPGRGGRWT